MNLYQFISDNIKSTLITIPELLKVDLSNIIIEIPKDKSLVIFQQISQ